MKPIAERVNHVCRSLTWEFEEGRKVTIRPLPYPWGHVWNPDRPFAPRRNDPIFALAVEGALPSIPLDVLDAFRARFEEVKAEGFKEEGFKLAELQEPEKEKAVL